MNLKFVLFVLFAYYLSMYRVAIFDLNGTIIEDELLWRVAFNDVFHNHGGNGQVETKPGMGNHSNWEIIKKNNPSLEQFSTDKLSTETADSYMHHIDTNLGYRNGFENFIQFLHEKDVLCVLATSSSQYALYRVAEVFPKLLEHFSIIVHGDEVERRKPAPDIFLKAYEKLSTASDIEDIHKDDCVIFEDSNAGLKAANSVNMYVVHLPNGMEYSDSSLSPNLVVQDFTDKRIYELFGGGEE